MNYAIARTIITIDTTDSYVDISVPGKTRGNPEFTESIIVTAYLRSQGDEYLSNGMGGVRPAFSNISILDLSATHPIYTDINI